ncbi:MAG: SDR family NAD(P)-dependent oxidoreductase, partial [Planctomycetota bacterium]
MSEGSRRVAMVTGSATGVGRACALQFASRGFDVVLNYSRSNEDAERTLEEVQQCGVRVRLIQCDVSDDKQVRRMLGEIEEHFGRLDALVNNAAVTSFV